MNALPHIGKVSHSFLQDDHVYCIGDVEVRAQYRHIAIVVGIRGDLTKEIVDPLADYLRHFTLAYETPLILDLTEVRVFSPEALWLLCVIDAHCRKAGTDWMLVGSPAVNELLNYFDNNAQLPVAHSCGQALATIANSITTRRASLLPLLRKSA